MMDIVTSLEHRFYFRFQNFQIKSRFWLGFVTQKSRTVWTTASGTKRQTKGWDHGCTAVPVSPFSSSTASRNQVTNLRQPVEGFWCPGSRCFLMIFWVVASCTHRWLKEHFTICFSNSLVMIPIGWVSTMLWSRLKGQKNKTSCWSSSLLVWKRCVSWVFWLKTSFLAGWQVKSHFRKSPFNSVRSFFFKWPCPATYQKHPQPG